MLCELNVPCFSSTGLLLHMASQPAVVCGRCVVAAVCCCSLGFLQMGAVLLNGCRTKTLEIYGSNMIDLAIHTSNFDTNVADSGSPLGLFLGKSTHGMLGLMCSSRCSALVWPGLLNNFGLTT